MKNKIIFCYCIVSLSSYASEDSSSDYSRDANCPDSSSAVSIPSTESARSTPVPPLNIASVQRTRSNSMPPSPQFIKLSPKSTISPRKKQVQKVSFGVEPSLLLTIADNAFRRLFEEKPAPAEQVAPSNLSEMEEKKKNSLLNDTLEELRTIQKSLEEEIEEISAKIDNMNIEAYENIKILSDADAAQEVKTAAIAAGKIFREQLRQLNKKRDELRNALSTVEDEKEKREED